MSVILRFTLIPFFCLCCLTSAVAIQQAAKPSSISDLSAEEIVSYSNKEIGKKYGIKLSFKEKLVLSLVRKKIKKQQKLAAKAKKPGKSSSNILGTIGFVMGLASIGFAGLTWSSVGFAIAGILVGLFGFIISFIGAFTAKSKVSEDLAIWGIRLSLFGLVLSLGFLIVVAFII